MVNPIGRGHSLTPPLAPQTRKGACSAAPRRPLRKRNACDPQNQCTSTPLSESCLALDRLPHPSTSQVLYGTLNRLSGPELSAGIVTFPLQVVKYASLCGTRKVGWLGFFSKETHEQTNLP
jgi:hypothetical protein